jgi:hypothetical protein
MSQESPLPKSKKSDEENENEDQDPFGENYELVKVIL